MNRVPSLRSGHRLKTLPSLLAMFRASLDRLDRFFDDGELQFALHAVDAVKEDMHAVADRVCLLGALADDLARVLAEGVAVVGKSLQRHQALDEKVRELNEEAEFG